MSTEFKPTPTEPQPPVEESVSAVAEREAEPTGGWAIAVLRIATGFVFLWAFLDKTFGFGYATPREGAWIQGGEPTKGYLSGLEAGPFREIFHNIAGAGWADWLFMVGLLGVGIAVILGIGLRISAVAGSLMMFLMWVADWPLARFGVAGDPTMSTNPIVDYHVIYALVLIACAAVYAGRTLGLGRRWEQLGFVERNRWLV